MRSCYFLWMLVIAGLISTMAYSKTNALDNFLLLHYSSHSGGFQHIPLPASTADPNIYAPVIYNTEQNHSFAVTSLPGSPATTVTLFFDDAVKLVTFESGISVSVTPIRNDKYQVDINLSASKQVRTRAFSLIGTGTLDTEKNKVNGQPRQLKPLFYDLQREGGKKTTTTAKQWGHIVRYQGQLKSDLYSEQEAGLQQPAPSTAVVMVVIPKDDPAPTAANEGESTQPGSGSGSGTGDQPPTSTQEAGPPINNSDGTGISDELSLIAELIGLAVVCPNCGRLRSTLLFPRHPEEKSETKDTTTTSQSCDSKGTKEGINKDRKEDPDDPSDGKPSAVH